MSWPGGPPRGQGMGGIPYGMQMPHMPYANAPIPAAVTQIGIELYGFYNTMLLLSPPVFDSSDDRKSGFK